PGKVRLLCHLDLREEMLDRFGTKIPLIAVDSNHFETVIDAAVSDGLVSWIMNFGDKIKVISPQQLADAVKKKALKIADIY
ncbi:MAG: WYL domain-containing protein, partial [Eubacterium sp.]|nr:WYL domain-containing protein [Eubacterium sp.]